MCGIVGFIDFNSKSNQQILSDMTDSLAHRGPDGRGSFIDVLGSAKIGFGHRRLSIIDLSTVADQPMHYKQFSIVFNGEIYNYSEIRTNLIQKGHLFNTHSDTEVILHAYEEWGHQAIKQFVGMFSFVILDREKGQIIAYRDRPGIKPFFYYWNDGLFLFSSELKAFHKHPSFEKNINLNAVTSFMRHGCIPAPYTIFNDAHKLKAGHYLIFDITTKNIKTEQYWNIYDLYNRPKLSISMDEAIEETERIFKKAFEYRMVSDVPVGVFLSGGYDSTCVTALLQKDKTEKIRTFSIGMEDPQLDESPYARAIANHLGTDHTEHVCSENEAKDIISDLPFYYDEPFADSSAIPTILVSRLAREKVTVALSADAGDEVFAGYNKYHTYISQRSKLSNFPKSLGNVAYQVFKHLPIHALPIKKTNSGFINKFDRLTEMLKDLSFQNIYALSSELFTVREINQLFKANVTYLTDSYRSNELQKPFFDNLTYMMAIDFQTYLCDDILQKVDRASMGVGLEAREPFLDHNVVDWASQMPLDFKYKNGRKKIILKEIVHKYVPIHLMDRPKMGFAVPVKKWLKFGLKELVNVYFEEEFIKKQGIFDSKAIKELTEAFYKYDSVPPEKIWYLLMFQMWYKKWM